jgi:hypothetical protein
VFEEANHYSVSDVQAQRDFEHLLDRLGSRQLIEPRPSRAISAR